MYMEHLKFTWVSVKQRPVATSNLLGRDRYLFSLNCFSSSSNCWLVKAVRGLRVFPSSVCWGPPKIENVQKCKQYIVSVPIEPWVSIFLNEFLGGVQLIFDLPGVVIKTGFYWLVPVLPVHFDSIKMKYHQHVGCRLLHVHCCMCIVACALQVFLILSPILACSLCHLK